MPTPLSAISPYTVAIMCFKKNFLWSLVEMQSIGIQLFTHSPDIYWVLILMLDTGDLWKQDIHDPYPCEAQSLVGRKLPKYNSTIKVMLCKKSIGFYERK